MTPDNNPYVSSTIGPKSKRTRTRWRLLAQIFLAALAAVTALALVLNSAWHWVGVYEIGRDYGWDIELLRLLIWPRGTIYRGQVGLIAFCMIILFFSRKQRGFRKNT